MRTSTHGRRCAAGAHLHRIMASSPALPPAAEPHAGPDAARRHAGDLGNLSADAGGSARYDRVDSHIRLNGPNSIIGLAVISPSTTIGRC